MHVAIIIVLPSMHVHSVNRAEPPDAQRQLLSGYDGEARGGGEAKLQVKSELARPGKLVVLIIATMESLRMDEVSCVRRKEKEDALMKSAMEWCARGMGETHKDPIPRAKDSPIFFFLLIFSLNNTVAGYTAR